MIKFLRITCIVILCSFLVAIYIGKKSITHIDYNDFISSASYLTHSTDDIIRQYKLGNVLIDDKKINSLADLFEQSTYVLKVSVNENPILYGDGGLINKVKILDVLKGNNNSNMVVGNTIKVYDLIMWWGETYIDYYGGMTPLNKEYQYIIFIKDAPSPSLKDTYIFSSIKYGHFNISIPHPNILLNYTQGSLYMKDVMKYDYVQVDCDSISTTNCDTDIESYSILKQQLLETLNK